MINVVILGLGTVGTGVYEILTNNKLNTVKEPITIKKILVNDISKKRNHNIDLALITDSFEDILKINDIDIAICVIGGFEPEYTYIKKLLIRGINVITANKEVVSRDISGLLQLAKESNVEFMFEASVGGGIPIISSIIEILQANNINRIDGILNGTTNYILTRLSRSKLNFNEVLKEAQEKGFAEANPSADIDGFDILRKIVILSSIAFKCTIPEGDVHLRGIRNITKQDIDMADSFGYSIKYIAQGLNNNNKYSLSVTPVFLKKDSIISNVNEEYNIVLVDGDIVGKQCFIGKGAGQNATAHAVINDLVKVINKTSQYRNLRFDEDLTSSGVEGIENEYYLRVTCPDFRTLSKAFIFIDRYINKNKFVFSENNLYLLTERMKSTDMKNLYESLQNISDDVFYARLEHNLL